MLVFYVLTSTVLIPTIRPSMFSSELGSLRHDSSWLSRCPYSGSLVTDIFSSYQAAGQLQNPYKNLTGSLIANPNHIIRSMYMQRTIVYRYLTANRDRGNIPSAQCWHRHRKSLAQKLCWNFYRCYCVQQNALTHIDKQINDKRIYSWSLQHLPEHESSRYK